jgi:hypothetical protein
VTAQVPVQDQDEAAAVVNIEIAKTLAAGESFFRVFFIG